ncbi:MAG TPA: helix-turn-helix domain-containing protein, partial [Thermomicrobiales bacterium]|nr:helix-turn-helix domain-containing protein [Thermomicrobiales bacterium]
PAPPGEAGPLSPAQQSRPRLAPACWPEIAARAENESLRDLAAAYGVSHETIQAVVRRATRPLPDTMTADGAPIRCCCTSVFAPWCLG